MGWFTPPRNLGKTAQPRPLMEPRCSFLPPSSLGSSPVLNTTACGALALLRDFGRGNGTKRGVQGTPKANIIKMGRFWNRQSHEGPNSMGNTLPLESDCVAEHGGT